jgi:hypothetical protein
MSDQISRRTFATLGASLAFGTKAGPALAKQQDPKPAPQRVPTEAPFERDYPAPDFTPSWKKPQLNRQMLSDFVIYAHMDLEMTKKLLAKEPLLINGVMDWGAGDWESGLGGACHMGRRDIVEYLLSQGARMDIFCATMMGQLEAVKSFLTLQPKLIDSRGPHGFSLHFHAQLAGKDADKMVAYLQSVKKIELKPNPFVKPPPA